LRDLTPIIVGVGEASERIDASDYAAQSPAELAGRAAKAALDDARSVDRLASAIDVIAAIRQFEISGPNAVAPFGRADNFPRAVARRIRADPARAILEPVGGQGPQHLVNELAQGIARGEISLALNCGAEAISTVRHLTARGEKRDWGETVGGQLEDRGFGDPLLTAELARHGARTPINVYALFENARRARLRLGRADYALEMAKLFAPFTRVAAENPHAMSQTIYTSEELATVTPANRLTSDPYPRRMVARDQANQGAAVLLTSVARAQELGIPESRFVYLHSGADVKERTPIERQDLSLGPASVLAIKHALGAAGRRLDDIALFDFYSCFPIAVFNVRDGLGMSAADPRPLTVTGGLPYFGGAGNNYSMHAIASMTRTLRLQPDNFGLVAANGGFLSKYSVGIYSARRADWKGFDSASLQAEVDAWPAPRVEPGQGAGTVESYTIDYSGPKPRAIVVGKLEANGARFVAMTDPEDATIAQMMIAADPLESKVTSEPNDQGRSVIRSFVPAS
jgi:acetyl-CoA C-acetyltransferase